MELEPEPQKIHKLQFQLVAGAFNCTNCGTGARATKNPQAPVSTFLEKKFCQIQANGHIIIQKPETLMLCVSVLTVFQCG